MIEECPALPQELVCNGRLLPDRDAILPLLPKGGVIAEVGVALGDFSRKLIDICAPSLFIGIDSFVVHTYPMLWGRPTQDIFGGATHQEFYSSRFREEIEQGRMRVLAADSAVALATLEDHSVDVFYVDADHRYDAVSRELSIIRHKVKDDGWIIMNDYTMADIVGVMEHYGVIHATNEFMLVEGWEMTHFAFQNFMYCDVVLRKLPPERAAEFRAHYRPPEPRLLQVADTTSTVTPELTSEVAHELVPVNELAAAAPCKPPEEIAFRLTELERENQLLRSELGALRASTSWRVTSPLRAMSRRLRQG